MGRAVLLCLQHPQVVSSVPPDDFDINPKLAGADVLLRLIGYCDSEPQITTARLLERFRDDRSHDYLVKLATRPYYPDGRDIDSDSAVTDFSHCIARLRERSRQTLTDKVDLSARTGLLGLRRR